MELHRLSDGEHRRWTVPVGFEATDSVLWITADEMGIAVNIPSESIGTLFRIPIDSLPVVEDGGAAP
jgi:hypothetical protein